MGLKVTSLLVKTVAAKIKSPYIAPEVKAITLPIGPEMKALAGVDTALLGRSINPSAGFKTQEEIIQYFKNIGLDIRIEDFSEKHLETFNLIRDDVELLKRMGVADSLPKGICLSDWRNAEKTKQIFAEYDFHFPVPPERRAYCGDKSGITLFINSSEEAQQTSKGVFRKFKHEIGHRRHYTYNNTLGTVGSNGSKSVLGQGIQSDTEFIDRQLQVLGIEAKIFKPTGNEVVPLNLTLSNTQILKDGSIKCLLPIQTSQGIKPLPFDITKAVAYLNSKCHCYNKIYYSEQVAEIFEDLLKGRRFDDLTMLMYDFAGGGRIPNLIIKGQKYDDYIKSLYENKELVSKLKEFINIS